jgi:glycosyltransferase involved in cell wall biosynthesis
MVHVPNFVNLADFEPSVQAGDYFLYFGRLAPEKGLSTLIKASAAAGVRLKVVGTGPDEALLKALAAQLDHPVEFDGYLSGAALHEAIRGARAVVLPSEWYENAPVSVLEAYALGVPVIGADIGGIPEMVRSGETGQIVASADGSALSDVLENFAAAADADVHAMGMAGRAWAGESFSTELHMERVQAVLVQIGLQ